MGTGVHPSAWRHSVETSFGTNAAAWAFAATTNYDFFSPPVLTAVEFKTSDKAGGTIVMANTGASGAADFAVKASMQFYDYDPVTGEQSLIVNAAGAESLEVKHGEKMSWGVPKVHLPKDYYFPAGHVLHVSVTVDLVSGNPGSSGMLLYDGARGTTTEGELPENKSWSWAFGQPEAPKVYITKLPDGGAHLSLLGQPNATYSIQAATNLVAPDWTTIATTNTDPSGLLNFTDLDSTYYPCRFYRISTH